MATVRQFEELKAWQEGREIAEMVYAATRVGEFAKDFGLKDQIQRAVEARPYRRGLRDRRWQTQRWGATRSTTSTSGALGKRCAQSRFCASLTAVTTPVAEAATVRSTLKLFYLK